MDQIFFWMPDLKGVFSVSSAREIIRQKYHVLPGVALLWRKAVHPMLAAQKWKIMRGACATLDKVQSGFKISLSNRCCLCRSAEESLDHILWSCTFAQSARTWIAEIFGLRPHQDFIIAYKSAEGKSPIVKDLWLIVVLVTRSELWNIRNKIVFEKKTISWSFFRKRIFTLIHDYSSRLKSFMFNFVEELQILNFFKVHHRQVNHTVPVEVFWVPPERGEIMLCCDGATRGNGAGIAGAGVVVRDEECNVLGAMSIGLGITNSFLAELYGIIVGLEWAVKWGIRRVLIWSDSVSAIYALENMALPWFVIQRWEDVRQLYDSIRFKHTYRETNFAADIMAKRGCQLGEGEGINYDGRPDFLNSIEYPHVSYFRFK